MKRLNPETGKPFKAGDSRADGMVFRQYKNCVGKHGYFLELWGTPKVAEAVKNKLREYSKIHYIENKDRILEVKKQYRSNNVDKLKKAKRDYYDKNKEAILEAKKTYRQRAKGNINYLNACRKKSVRLRTPAWLTAEDKWYIKEVYDLAVLRTRLTGVSWHVDHIVPLQGKTVSGLHVPWNLQVIPAKDNIAKKNRWDNA